EQFKELMYQFEDLGYKAERDCGDIFDAGPDYDNFNEVYIDDDHHEIAEEIFEKIAEEVVKRVLDHLQGINANILNDMLEAFEDKFEEQIAMTLEAIYFVPEEYHEELLSQKKNILSQVESLEEAIAELEAKKQALQNELEELKALQEEIAAYNFIGDAAADIEEEVAGFVAEAPGFSKNQVAAKVKALKEAISKFEVLTNRNLI
ncbi:MAG: hypothetical protein IH946_10220, partial [Bacteroidetes bacterium]|nr:hypothetical protein [Bacteroidota bacterium]